MDMLMDVHPEDRWNFLRRVTFGARPHYRMTWPGKKDQQDWWKLNQPNIYAAYRREDECHGSVK